MSLSLKLLQENAVNELRARKKAKMEDSRAANERTLTISLSLSLLLLREEVDESVTAQILLGQDSTITRISVGASRDHTRFQWTFSRGHRVEPRGVPEIAVHLRMSAKGGRRHRVEGKDESVSSDKDGQSGFLVVVARLCYAAKLRNEPALTGLRGL